MSQKSLRCNSCSLNEGGVCMAFNEIVSEKLYEEICIPYRTNSKTISKITQNQIVSPSKELNSNSPTFDEFYEKLETVDIYGNKSIDVLDLTDEMFKGNNYILNKYFRYKDHSLDRICFYNITEDEYKNILSALSKQPKNPEDLELETASSYWRKKIYAICLADDLGVKAKEINIKDWVDNPDYYEFYDFDENQRWLEDKFREENNEVERREVLRTQLPDEDLINEVYSTCIFLIKNRLAMIFEVYPILLAIEDIIEFTEGLHTNCLKNQLNILVSFKEKVIRIFESGKYYTDLTTGEKYFGPVYTTNKNNERVIKYPAEYELLTWLRAGNNDYTLYANKNTLKMYIEEYHKIVCKLNDIYGDYPEEDEDILEDYINMAIANEQDMHLIRAFVKPDISDYLYSKIRALNNRVIKLNTENSESLENPVVVTE